MSVGVRVISLYMRHSDDHSLRERGQYHPMSTDRNWRQFNYRLKKLEVVCLVVKNSKLNYDLCFSYRNMLKKVVILASFLDS